MKYLILVFALLGATLAEPQYCDAKKDSCEKAKANNEQNVCCETSKLAGFVDGSDLLSKELTDYAWKQIASSYDLLFLSTTFDTYTKDRPGFEKLYRGLSDKAWGKAIDLIKYVTKRGGKISKFDQAPKSIVTSPVAELVSLEKAVLIEKDLAAQAYKLHDEVQSHRSNEKKYLDAGIAHYIEEEFIEEQEDTIRELVGHYNDFKTLVGGEAQCTANKNTELACFMFDNHLNFHKTTEA